MPKINRGPQPAIEPGPYEPLEPQPAIEPGPYEPLEPQPAIDPVPYPGDRLVDGGPRKPRPAIDPGPPGGGWPYGGRVDPITANVVSGHERHLAVALKSALAGEKVLNSDLTHVSNLSRAFEKGADGGYWSPTGDRLMRVFLSSGRGPAGAAGSGSSTFALVNPNNNTWQLVRTRGLDGAGDYSPPYDMPAGIHFNGRFSGEKIALLEDIANGR